MADIELVIKIPEEDYQFLKEGYSHLNIKEHLIDTRDNRCYIAIAKGTPLPKGHGRLIDADSIPSYRIRGITEYCRGYNDRTTEVENAIVNAPTILK